jgi:hypothetical protein
MTSVPRLMWLLLALALVGAAASLFGFDERWWGLDIGATGAALFGLTLWVGAWLFARQPDAVFPVEWSSRKDARGRGSCSWRSYS